MPSVMNLGTDEGYAEPSLPGQSNPFPYENLHADIYRRLAENRIAGLGNKTCDFALNQNDVVNAHRAVYTNRQAARNPRVLAAFHPGVGQGYSATGVPSNPRAGTGTLTDLTGKAITSTGEITRLQGSALSSAAGFQTLNAGRANELFIQWLTVADSDVVAAPILAVRMTDGNNMIQLSRQAAGNIRTTRVVASAFTTERDTAISASTPISGNAYGLRLSGTSAQLFVNGLKVDDWTLNAAAQGLTGTLAGVGVPTNMMPNMTIPYFEIWSLTPVLGV